MLISEAVALMLVVVRKTQSHRIANVLADIWRLNLVLMHKINR